MTPSQQSIKLINWLKIRKRVPLILVTLQQVDGFLGLRNTFVTVTAFLLYETKVYHTLLYTWLSAALFPALVCRLPPATPMSLLPLP